MKKLFLIYIILLSSFFSCSNDKDNKLDVVEPVELTNTIWECNDTIPVTGLAEPIQYHHLSFFDDKFIYKGKNYTVGWDFGYEVVIHNEWDIEGVYEYNHPIISLKNPDFSKTLEVTNKGLFLQIEYADTFAFRTSYGSLVNEYLYLQKK